MLTCNGEDSHPAVPPNFVLCEQVGQQHQHPAVILELTVEERNKNSTSKYTVTQIHGRIAVTTPLNILLTTLIVNDETAPL